MAAAAVAALLSVLVSVGSASAVTLKGEWAPFNRCPVDNATMLSTNVNEGFISVCLAVQSKKGSLKIGNVSLNIGPSDTQMGVLGEEAIGKFDPISPEGSAIVAAPIEIPGGLAGLVCPKGQDFKGDICKASRPARLNKVTATLESAGTPANFELFAAFEAPKPIMALPVKIHLKNPLLGANCYIGSKAHPIVVQPVTVKVPGALIQRYALDGGVDPEGGMFETIFYEGSQADTQFAVPAATGCGFAGVLTHAINQKVGLPSPAGSNSILLDETTSFLVGLFAQTATDGQDLSKYWHEAVE
ncbi:MAG TPA: hypothetical protein VFY36_01760 [Solirubrobacteraceae bacterium]|nr:hypothetical protein [Solirubrobacteraceae bacterium]